MQPFHIPIQIYHSKEMLVLSNAQFLFSKLFVAFLYSLIRCLIMEHVRVCDDDDDDNNNNDIYPWMVKKMRINKNVPHRASVRRLRCRVHSISWSRFKTKHLWLDCLTCGRQRHSPSKCELFVQWLKSFNSYSCVGYADPFVLMCGLYVRHMEQLFDLICVWPCIINVGKVNMEHQLDATIIVLLISKISSTCFRQTFAHLQERKTEIFTTYGIMSCWCGRQGFWALLLGTTCTVWMRLFHWFLQVVIPLTEASETASFILYT
jgi:hypothetical protein